MSLSSVPIGMYRKSGQLECLARIATPQVRQKRVSRRSVILYVDTFSRPDNQRKFLLGTSHQEPKADPVNRRQIEQWQKLASVGSPSNSYRTCSQWQCPVRIVLSASNIKLSARFAVCPFYLSVDRIVGYTLLNPRMRLGTYRFTASPDSILRPASVHVARSGVRHRRNLFAKCLQETPRHQQQHNRKWQSGDDRRGLQRRQSAADRQNGRDDS